MCLYKITSGYFLKILRIIIDPLEVSKQFTWSQRIQKGIFLNRVDFDQKSASCYTILPRVLPTHLCITDPIARTMGAMTWSLNIWFCRSLHRGCHCFSNTWMCALDGRGIMFCEQDSLRVSNITKKKQCFEGHMFILN